MLRATWLRLRTSKFSTIMTDPLDLFSVVQSGAPVPPRVAKNFILGHFSERLMEMGLTEARVSSLDPRSATALLRKLMFDQFVSIPFSVYAMDLEFTGLPEAGRTQSIVEMAFYSPDNDASFSTLVKPLPGATMSEGASKLTKITDDELAAAPHFDEAWADAQDFFAVNAPSEEAQKRVLLLSHGAKLADVKLLHDCAAATNTTIPAEIRFGDTYNVLRDLHRRRPVTKERLPPSWSLEEQAHWLGLDTSDLTLHRALPDAKLTWRVLHHTMDRYGDESLSPRQQLVGRYFPDDGERTITALEEDPAAQVTVLSGKAKHRGVRAQSKRPSVEVAVEEEEAESYEAEDDAFA